MRTKTTKNTVKQLVTTLRTHFNIPVFANNLPPDQSTICIVVCHDRYHHNIKQDEYNINVYVPNIRRVFGSYVDNSYPDTDYIEDIGEEVIKVLSAIIPGITEKQFHIRKYIQERNMHYMNICLLLDSITAPIS